MPFSFLIFSYAILLLIDGIIFQSIAAVRDINILYPAFFGGLVLLMGLVTLKKDFQIYAKHGATALSVIAFISSVTDLSELLQNLTTADYARISNSIMAVISIVFLILAVQQFAKERNS